MEKNTRCKHWNGLLLNTHCEAGVSYDEVGSKVPDVPYRTNLPCHDPANGHLCSFHKLWTDEEFTLREAERDRLVSDFILNLAKLNDRETENCIHCGQKIESMHQVGRCTYAKPCGCRLWQGKVPEAWK